MISVRTSDGRKAVAMVRARNGADALKSAVRVSVRNASNVLKLAWSALTTSLSRTSVEGFGDSTASITIQTGGVTASAVGGTDPFTYGWAQTGGDDATILSPTAANTAFRFAGVDPGSSKVGIFVCTITDSAGSSASTAAVTATATNVSTV